MQLSRPVTPENTRCDRLFGGRLRLWQAAEGHRAGTDAVLLAAACPDAARIADLGAGAGTVGLRAAQMHPGATVVLVEREAEIAALAARNVAENGLSARVSIAQADVMVPAFGGIDRPCDVVLTNPPFDDPSRVRLSPDVRRAAAHALDGGIEGWLKAALKCLTPQGRLVMIHRADALERILAAMRGRFGGIALRPVHPRADAPASRLLIHAKRGSKAPLVLLPPLILHQVDGAFTPQAEAIHRGDALLPAAQQTR